MVAPTHSPRSPQAFYITTPIYYVNAVPHLGTFYSTVVADAMARYHRARGDQTFFLTGLDEHGQKIERMAAAQGQTPQAYCDGIAGQFQATWKRATISQDRFIRTTDVDHETAVIAMWHRMEKNGDLYLADYEGLYCVDCEEWKTEEDVVTEGGEKVCPTHRKPIERVKEKNTFFRLSKYADRLLELYLAQANFIRPGSRKNEVISFVKGGLRDLSVSRMAVKWGIPVPGAPQHTIYVWIDALTNYLSALGGPAAAMTDARARSLWAGSHHIIAKDILRFHAVYWPAMLMSAGLPPPKTIFCHGYLTVKGQKIAKSVPATRVDPNLIADSLGMDALRYFVLREYTFGSDGDFTYEALLQRHESDLGNDLGNLVNRTVAMGKQYLGGQPLPAHPPRAASDPMDSMELDLRTDAIEACRQASAAWEDFAPSRALESIWSMIRNANGYIDRTAPWKLHKAGELADVKAVLANTAEIIRHAAMMVAPAMPDAAREILRQIGREEDVGKWPSDDWRGWPGATLGEPRPIFPRVEANQRAALLEKWTGAVTGAASASGPPSTPVKSTGAAALPIAAPGEIAIEDFARIDLRAAKVLAAEPVPKTEKLLKLTLDLGGEQRTVVSGIAGAYSPKAIIGLTVIYLANLKPAKIRGVVSQGMILAAGADQTLALLALDRDVPPGTKIG